MGIFNTKADYKEVNAKPVFQTRQQEQQTDVSLLFNQQARTNVFRNTSGDKEPVAQAKKTRKYGTFGKGKATEIESVGKLESIKPADVENSMLSCVNQDLQTLQDDVASVDVLLKLKFYNTPGMSIEDKKTFFNELKTQLDAVFVTETIQVSEQGKQLLRKYYDHFNQLAIGELQLPTQFSSLQASYTMVDAVTNPPLEMEFPGFEIKQKDMSDVPLFDHEPHVTDIQQGYIGDCFFLAATASLVNKDPKAIKQMMHDNGDGTVTVRFHKVSRVYENLHESYWRDKSFDQLAPEEKIAKLLLNYSDKKVTNSLVKPIVSYISGSGPELAVSLAKEILDSGLWQNKSLTPSGDDTPEQTLQKQLDLLGQADQAKLAELSNNMALMTVSDLGKRAQDGEKSYMNSIDTSVYVTVKKEVTVFAHNDEPAYAKGALWTQILERAFAASGLYVKSNNEQDKSGYQAINCGGQAGVATKSLCGQKVQTLYKNKTYDDVNTSSTYSLSGALKDELGALDAPATFVSRLRNRIPALKNAPEKTINDLIQLLEKSDKKNLRTIQEITFRSQAANLDDLVPLILDSRLALIEGKRADSKENAVLRAELAKQLENLIASSKKSVLSFTPFSGKYSKAADNVFSKIVDSLSKGQTVNASTAGFVPKKITDREGLNNESMKDGLAETHAYSVIGTKEEQGIKYVTLRNPWGRTIRSYYKTESGRIIAMENRTAETGGVFHIELNDFYANFYRVDAN